MNVIRVIVGNLSPFKTGFNVRGEQIALHFKIELLKVIKSGETLPVLDGKIIDILQGQEKLSRGISLNRISHFRFVYELMMKT